MYVVKVWAQRNKGKGGCDVYITDEVNKNKHRRKYKDAVKQISSEIVDQMHHTKVDESSGVILCEVATRMIDGEENFNMPTHYEGEEILKILEPCDVVLFQTNKDESFKMPKELQKQLLPYCHEVGNPEPLSQEDIDLGKYKERWFEEQTIPDKDSFNSEKFTPIWYGIMYRHTGGSAKGMNRKQRRLHEKSLRKNKVAA